MHSCFRNKFFGSEKIKHLWAEAFFKRVIPLFSRICQLCPNNTFFDGRSCVYGKKNCPKSNQIWNGLECICAQNFYMISDACVTCPSWTSWNGSRCIAKNTLYSCSHGQIFVDGQCIFVGYWVICADELIVDFYCELMFISLQNICIYVENKNRRE